MIIIISTYAASDKLKKTCSRSHRRRCSTSLKLDGPDAISHLGVTPIATGGE